MPGQHESMSCESAPLGPGLSSEENTTRGQGIEGGRFWRRFAFERHSEL